MYFIIALLCSLVSSFIIHTNLETYVKTCNTGYIEELFEDITTYETDIRAFIKNTYGKIFDKYITEIIIINKHDKYAGLFCSPSIIVLDKRTDFESVLTHELMHLMHYHVPEFNNEWNKLNKFGYIKEETKVVRQGFVTAYGMTSMHDDIATFYEELMLYTYSKQNLLQYDPIIITKFTVLYKILIKFNILFVVTIQQKVLTNFNFQTYFNERSRPIIVPENMISLMPTDASYYNTFKNNNQWWYISVSGTTESGGAYYDRIYNVPRNVRLYYTNQKYIDIGNNWLYYYNNNMFGRIEINRFKNNTFPNITSMTFDAKNITVSTSFEMFDDLSRLCIGLMFLLTCV